MEDTKKLVAQLVSIPGLSGHEIKIREHLTRLWEPLTDEIQTSKLGSLHALIKGDGVTPRKRILIATHMDAIGMMVTAIEDGLLRLTKIGGIDNRTLPGLPVNVHTQSGDLPGVVILPPAHTLPDEQDSKKTIELKYLLVDTGLSATEVSRKVNLGDLVTFNVEPLDLGDGYLSAPYMDNRSSVAILTQILQILQTRNHQWDVWAVATAQEEIDFQGAITSGYALRPTIAVVVDVTFANGPGTPSHESFDMDEGPTFDIGPSTHPKLYQAFIDFAEKREISFHRGVHSRSSGTDADGIQLAAEGIPTMLIGLPLRYMHTPVEMIQVRDIQRTAHLIAEFIEQLDDKFMDTLSWDEESELI
jgi:putative aminopeptidase FrvX